MYVTFHEQQEHGYGFPSLPLATRASADVSELVGILDAILPLKSFYKLYLNRKTNIEFLDCWIFFTHDKCNCL